MTEEQNKLGLNQLTGNQLKLIALIAMTCDHVGKELLPEYDILQVVGRLAFPIFAYMIAEGCRYTKDRQKHLLHIAGLAALCQLVYLMAEKSLFQCILVTFTLSICVIYVIDFAKKKQTAASRLGAAAVCIGIYFVSDILPVILQGTDFEIDYGIWGILLPIGVYFAPKRWRLPVTAAILVPLCLSVGGLQWYSLAAVVLLALYSGKRGKAKIKNLFFIYYPAHLAVIYLLSNWVF